MLFSIIFSYALSTLVSLTQASPVDLLPHARLPPSVTTTPVKRNNLLCLLDSDILALFSGTASSSALAFCSSFIHVPVVTSTVATYTPVTITSVTTTPPASTVTAPATTPLATVQVTTAITQVVMQTVYVTPSTVTITTNACNGQNKRAVQTTTTTISSKPTSTASSSKSSTTFSITTSSAKSSSSSCNVQARMSSLGSAMASQVCSCLSSLIVISTTSVTATVSTSTHVVTQTATASTTTTTPVAPTSTITNVNTAYATTVSTVTVTVAVPTATVINTGRFQLQAQGSSYDQQYAQISSAGNALDYAIVFTSSAALASVFVINTAGHLSDSTSTYFADVDSGSSASFLYFDTASTISEQGFQYAVCSVVNGMLQCAANAAVVFQISGQPYSGAGAGVAIAPYVLDGDSALSFKALPVC